MGSAPVRLGIKFDVQMNLLARAQPEFWTKESRAFGENGIQIILLILRKMCA